MYADRIIHPHPRKYPRVGNIFTIFLIVITFFLFEEDITMRNSFIIRPTNSFMKYICPPQILSKQMFQSVTNKIYICQSSLLFDTSPSLLLGSVSSSTFHQGSLEKKVVKRMSHIPINRLLSLYYSLLKV